MGTNGNNARTYNEILNQDRVSEFKPYTRVRIPERRPDSIFVQMDEEFEGLDLPQKLRMGKAGHQYITEIDISNVNSFLTELGSNMSGVKFDLFVRAPLPTPQYLGPSLDPSKICRCCNGTGRSE